MYYYFESVTILYFTTVVFLLHVFGPQVYSYLNSLFLVCHRTRSK